MTQCEKFDWGLSKLPKGSNCNAFEAYPAKSAYWRDETKSVIRCADWSTPGEDAAPPDRDTGGDDSDEGSEDDELPPVDRDELPTFDGFTLDMAQPDDIRWVWTSSGAPPGYPATIDVDPSDVALTIRVFSHGGQFKDRYSAERKYSWLVRGDRETDTSTITVAKTGQTAEDNRERAIDAVERWVEGHSDGDTSVEGWKNTEPEGDEIERWVAEYDHPMSDADWQYVVIEEIERRGDTAYFGFWYIGDPQADNPNRTRITSSPDKRVTLRETLDWLEGNHPDEHAVDLPDGKNGWDRTRLEVGGLEHWQAVVEWESFQPPNHRIPDKRKERIRIFKKDGKFHVRFAHIDEDGEDVRPAATDNLPTLPRKSSSMVSPTRGGGTRSSFSGLDDAMKYVREYMEDSPEEITDWPDIPRFDLRTKVGDFKDAMAHIKRSSPSEPGVSRLTGIDVNRTDLRFVGTDDANVAMYDIELLKDGFETNKINRDKAWSDSREQQGTGAFVGKELADEITDLKKSDSVWLRTFEPNETNAPVMLEVNQEMVTPIWPEFDRVEPDMPDLDLETWIELDGVSGFDDILKEAKGDDWGDDSPSVTLDSDGNRVRVSWLDESRILGVEDVSGDESVTLSVDKLRDFTMSVPRPGSTTVTGKYGEDMPIELFYSTSLYRLTYLMAPRIRTEQPEDSGCLPETDEYDLHEPIGKGDDAPDIQGIEWDGDSVVFTFPNADGCRCGTQIQQLQQMADETGTDVYAVAATPADELAEMKETYDLSIPLISDEDGHVSDAFGGGLLQGGKYERRLFFIRDGKVIDVSDGMTEPELAQPSVCLSRPLEDDATNCPFDGYGSLTGRVRGEIDSYELRGDDKSVADVLKHPGVYIVNGKRGSGKSSLAYTAADRLAEGKDVKKVAVGVPEPAAREFPGDWWFAESLEDVPNDSIVVVDEAYMKFNARTPLADENQGLAPLVNTSRHCDQTMFFVTQNTSALDRNAPAEADGILMKEPGTFHMRFERKQFRDLSEEAKSKFDEIPDGTARQPFTYIYTDEYTGMVKSSEAEWYSDEISKSFSGRCGVEMGDTTMH